MPPNGPLRPEDPQLGRDVVPGTIPPEEQHMGAMRLARRVFVSFIVTFALARSMALLMLVGRMHDFFLRFGQTHVHHLNYGIFILSGVGAYLIFVRPDARGVARAAALYGIGLALTFDEFGMWLHLDDIYWQRASFDAMVLIAAILGLVIAAPTVRRFRLRHWIWTTVVGIAVVWFTLLLMTPFKRMHERIAPWFRERSTVSDSTAAGQPPAGPSQRIRK
ncbi:MAG TPA: hypothetical protein VE402_08380 [Candidatus Angelobacter sp.]|nr:hypothetical protein [Candidatus Angelobacter sp.]